MIYSHGMYVLWAAWKFLSGQVTCVSTVTPKSKQKATVSGIAFQTAELSSTVMLRCPSTRRKGGTESTHPKTSEKSQHRVKDFETKYDQWSDMMKWHDDASPCMKQISFWKLRELQSRLTGSELFLWGRKGVLRRHKTQDIKVNGLAD